MGTTQTFQVRANLPDGSTQDVTSQASVSVSDTSILGVVAEGRVQALEPGQARLTARFGTLIATMNITAFVPPPPPPSGQPVPPPQAGGSSIAFVRTLGTGSATPTSGTTFVLTTSTASTAGDTILIVVSQVGSCVGGSGITAAIDSAGNTYTRDALVGASSNHSTVIMRCFGANSLPAGGTITMTTSGTASAGSGVAATACEFSGLTALDQTLVGFQNPAASQTPSVSTGATTAAPELVLSGFNAFETTATTPVTFQMPGAGFTALPDVSAVSASSGLRVCPQFKIVSTTGVQTATATFSASSLWDGAISTYR